MRLSFEQIQSIAKGAVRVAEGPEGILFYRFTKEQEKLYQETNEDFYQKTFSTAGVRLEFVTNSEMLFMRFMTKASSSRQFFSFDVFVNGKSIGYLDNFSDIQLPEIYPEAILPLGEYSQSFMLGKGEKTVSIYFPWSVQAILKELSLDDNAFVRPVMTEKKLLVFGDSITHGYDAKRSSMRYPARLANTLNAEEFNKAIGGERFFPELAETREDFEPDYVTVAYGTNDWSGISAEEFQRKSRRFYEALSNNYPNAKIFAITPIWRKDHALKKEFGLFGDVVTYLVDAVKDLKNVTVICGYSFVPENENYFSDKRLHPTDEGFDFYYCNLKSVLCGYIDKD